MAIVYRCAYCDEPILDGEKCYQIDDKHFCSSCAPIAAVSSVEFKEWMNDNEVVDEFLKYCECTADAQEEYYGDLI